MKEKKRISIRINLERATAAAMTSCETGDSTYVVGGEKNYVSYALYLSWSAVSSSLNTAYGRNCGYAPRYAQTSIYYQRTIPEKKKENQLNDSNNWLIKWDTGSISWLID